MASGKVALLEEWDFVKPFFSSKNFMKVGLENVNFMIQNRLERV